MYCFWCFGADLETAEEQLQDVLRTLEIDQSLSRSQQLAELRQVSAQDLITAMPSFRLDTFRAVTDEEFILGNMMAQLRDGTIARAFQDRGMRVIIGETETEVCLCLPRQDQALTDFGGHSNICMQPSTLPHPSMLCRQPWKTTTPLQSVRRS
jgi:carboxylesterase type B